MGKDTAWTSFYKVVCPMKDRPTRKCLKCGRGFLSLSVSNRLCNGCNTSNAPINPASPVMQDRRERRRRERES